MSGVGTTVVNGIQEISALLPLLGTEQCEEHVGSALYKGFIYVCISPISIFGSLGIVKAGFNVFLASLNIQSMRFLGAKKLNDGGFRPKGAVAPMIALDPKHPNRFLVESRLETMLADENIENVGDLTVSWDEGNFLWNFKLVLFTLLSTPLGLAPYLFIILKSRSQLEGDDPFFFAGWGFPIMRILGSALCVVVVQFLIQIRVLVIIRMRLLFMSVDRMAKDMNINLDSKQHNLSWNSHSTSETCIWDLENWLMLYGDEEKNGTNIKRCFEAARRRQFPPESRLTKFIRPSADFLLHILLAVGLILTVIGYIGCFNLVSNASGTSAGPVIWVALEALLSVLRIIVWAFNPSWDDSKGITFNLKLASHAPLITCCKSDDDIKADGIVSVARGNSFLEEMVAYTGPLPSFNWNNVALYYILTAGDAPTPCPADASLHAILYVVISDYKEQTCRVLTKRPGDDNAFDIYVSSLESDPRSTVLNVKFKTTNDGKRILTLPKTHSLTADTRFMEELARHYNKILSQVQKRRENVRFRTTWSLRRPDEKTLKEELEREEEEEELEKEKEEEKLKKEKEEEKLKKEKEEEKLKKEKEEEELKKGGEEEELKKGEEEEKEEEEEEKEEEEEEEEKEEEEEEEEKEEEEELEKEEEEDKKSQEGEEGVNEKDTDESVGKKNEKDGDESEISEIGQGDASSMVEEKTDEGHKDEKSEEVGAESDKEDDGVSEAAVSESGSSKKDAADHRISMEYQKKQCPRQRYLRLTPEDVVYIRQGQVERRWRELFERLEEWVEIFIALYSEELLQDVPPDLVFQSGESVTLVQKYEANEVEYLLIECRTRMEHLLDFTGQKWNSFVQIHHGHMVTAVLEHTFPEAETKKLDRKDKLLDDDMKHYQRSRREKMRARLATEWQRLLQYIVGSRLERIRTRLDANGKLTQQRIQQRKYHDVESEQLLGNWNDRLQLFGKGTSTLANQLPNNGGYIHQISSSSIHETPTDDQTNNVDKSDAVSPEYKKNMEKRFERGTDELGRILDETNSGRKSILTADFDLMKDRCRKRAHQLFSKMKDQSEEFMALDSSEYLIADVHDKRIYWSKDGLQERRRMMDRAHKYLMVSDTSIDKVGGAQNMIRALRISQEFSFLDFTESTKLSAKDVKQVVKDLKSLSGVTFRSPDGGDAIQKAVLTNVRNAMQEKKDTCFYQNVYATDHYRKGRPYLIFPYPKWSSCVVVFNVQEKRDYILTLKHCMTTSNGQVDIKLNDQVLDRTWGLSQDSKDFLINEDIYLPSAHVKDDEPNLLTITLAENSPGVYWLSDVFLPVRIASTTSS